MNRRFVALFATLSFFAAAPVLPQSSPVPATARKVVMEKAGAVYRWKVIEAPVPAVGETQVLVRVYALSLNRGDLDKIGRDATDEIIGHVPGTDAAGEVVAVGKRVKGIRKGERVTNTFFKNWADGPFSQKRVKDVPGWTSEGVLADYIAVEGTDVVPIAKTLSYEEASTLPTAGLTAWNAVVGQHPTRRGDVVLVQGTGGVSMLALQFAVASGAQVIVTSSSDEKLQRAKALGARDGINYKTDPDWSARVPQLTNGHGVDRVVDIGGKSTLEQSVKSLADGGTLSIVGGLTGYDGSISAWGLLMKAATAQSIFVGSNADFLRMNAFIDAHKLHPAIERVYPLEQYEEALKALDSGNFVGKIVLKLR